MNQTIIATPSDTIPSSRIIYSGSLATFTVTFDFTSVLAVGDSVSSATCVTSNSSVTINSTAYSGSTATLNVTSTMLDGGYCVISCTITSADGSHDGRSVRLTAYDKGTS